MGLKLLAILELCLVGCVTQVSQSDLGTREAEIPADVTLEEAIAKLNRFQGAGEWQRYTILKFTTQTGVNAQFKTTNNELLLTVTAENGNHHRHFFIPGVVHLNQGIRGKYSATIYPLEIMGVEAQIYLYALEKAFPEGPKSIKTKAIRHVEEHNNVTLEFLSGGMVLEAPWEAEVTAARTSPEEVDFSIYFTKKSSK